MRKNISVSLLIHVLIVVGFSAHILSTDQTYSLRMITGFLFCEITVVLNIGDSYPKQVRGSYGNEDYMLDFGP